jgi:hypothetical protein
MPKASLNINQLVTDSLPVIHPRFQKRDLVFLNYGFFIAM